MTEWLDTQQISGVGMSSLGPAAPLSVGDTHFNRWCSRQPGAKIVHFWLAVFITVLVLVIQ